MAIARSSHRFDPQRLSGIADGLAVALAVSLPWSTSATGILVVLWLIAVIPILSWAEIRREVLTPAGGLPVLLFVLGVVGMAWAGVTFAERWTGLHPFFKLLVIPLLLAQFRRSDRAPWVLGGYLLSCVVLLLASYAVAIFRVPDLLMHDFGVPVKNAATQSGEFATCILVLLFLAHEAVLRRRWANFAALSVVMLAMLANIFFVATGRTALVVLLVLLALFALRRLSLRGIVLVFAGAVVVVAAGWFSSPYLRGRVTQIWTDAEKYQATDAVNSSGERLEFYKKSIRFVRSAPVIGHGTGSMPALFKKAAAGQTGARGVVTTNPHNQTLAVAIQLGLVGAALLWAMWIAHLWLFRGGGLVAWIGFVLVVQNVVGSAFNSHLFDFVQGWVYVIGVGVVGGAVLKGRALKP
jgi:O-antigen ligase